MISLSGFLCVFVFVCLPVCIWLHLSSNCTFVWLTAEQMHLIPYFPPQNTFISLALITNTRAVLWEIHPCMCITCVFVFVYSRSRCVPTVWDAAAYWRSILTAYLLLAEMDSLERSGRDHPPAASHPRNQGNSPVAGQEVRLEQKPVRTLTDDCSGLYWHDCQLLGWNGFSHITATVMVRTPHCCYLWPCCILLLSAPHSHRRHSRM